MTAYIFDMISRTRQDELPAFNLFNKTLLFYGDLDTLSTIPIRLDIAIGDTCLVGDARHIETRKNHRGYEAEYSVYAIHYFEDKIPL